MSIDLSRISDVLNCKPVEDGRFPHPTHAYRAWARWAAELDGAGYQVRHAHALRDKAPVELVAKVLCEVYARATFEVALGWHFDELDSHADEQVAEHIRQLFNADTFAAVRAECERHGCVVTR